jgi:hypothetical protein
MNVSQPDHTKRLGCRTGSGDQETVVKRTQIEAPIESVAESGKVTCRVLSKVEGMVATRQTDFEIAEHGVDPLELLGLPSACARP